MEKVANWFVEIQEAKQLTMRQIHAEKVAGNIVKQNFWQGRFDGLTQAEAVLLSYLGLQDVVLDSMSSEEVTRELEAQGIGTTALVKSVMDIIAERKEVDDEPAGNNN